MKPTALPANLQTAPRVRFKNVLFATDLGEASAHAQAYAALVARMFGSHLYVLHADAGPGLSPRYGGAAPPVAKEPRKPSDARIHELKTFFQTSGIPYTLLLEHGEVQETLNRVVEECAIDLIILGSHGRHGVSYLFMGSTAEDVARSSKCPVITVGPQARPGLKDSFKTIVFATDFSEESKLALPYATSLAQEFRANLNVMHVAPRRERLVLDREQVEGYLLNQLKNLAPQSRSPWCAVSYTVTFGDTAQEILDAAKDRNADLIVLGLHSAVRFTSHLPERLSYRVLCEASCPVMSVLPGTRELKLARLPAEFLSSAPYMS